jgi:uncharacterized protein HemX
MYTKGITDWIQRIKKLSKYFLVNFIKKNMKITDDN